MSEKIITTEDEARDIQRPHYDNIWKREHNPDRCCASVHDGGRSVGFHQCLNRPRHWYGSLGYCGVHDPNYILKMKAKRDEKYAREAEARQRRAERNAREREMRDEAINVVRSIAEGHNNPRGLCVDLLKKYGQ